MLTKAQVKYIQSLGHKKLRDSEKAFIAEGPKLINELLNAGNVKPLGIYALSSFADAHPQLRDITIVKEAELERISGMTAPNEVLGVFSKPVFDKPVFRNTFSLMLDGIQDPGNMGSIIRSADWFGIRTIVCSSDSADNFNAKVVQSTMGSIARVQVIYTDLGEFIGNTDLPDLYAATLGGKSVYETDGLKEGMLIIGNESKGISAELLKKAKYHVTIPKKGNAESLNAGVAAGILISHMIGKK
jgi:TrmH family RNA methyltransferase